RPALGKAKSARLVELLAHSDVWWRTTAQRLLLQRQDPAAVAPLRKLCASAKEPRARLHAAWLLERQGRLDEPLLVRLLGDDHPRVREQAVLLAEPRLARSASLRRRVVALAGDRDDRVRFQVALSLGEWDD